MCTGKQRGVRDRNEETGDREKSANLNPPNP